MKRGAKPDGRLHLTSFLMRESLMDKKLLADTDPIGQLAIFPNLSIVSLGGRSIFDRGAEALVPLSEELLKARKRWPFVVGVGGGERERHTYAVGLDLGLPTGVLAMVGGAIPEQNALLLHALVADRGGIRIAKEDFAKLPVYLKSGAMPIVVGMPPYHYWEQPRGDDPLPQHGGDAGMFLLAEVFSTKRCIFVKDVDGVFTADPKKDPSAKLMREVPAKELLLRPDYSGPIEKSVLEMLGHTRHVREIVVINGLKRGELTKALEGRRVGTRILG